jgi:epoxyqueuosine reductase
MIDFKKDIVQPLLEIGASLTGFADLRELPENARFSMEYALSLAAALDPLIVSGITEGPTPEYYEEYKRTNRLLSHLTKEGARLLESFGFKAIPIEPTLDNFDRSTLRTALPHKTVATRAGLGWIGRNDLLITPEYGSAVRLSSILTDARLGEGKPINVSRCGTCHACVEACPAKAPSGRDWDVSLDRDDFLDVHACYRKAKEYAAERGYGSTICGICITVCPWTKKYLKQR